MELDPEKEPVIQTVGGVRRFTVVHLLRWECYFRGSNSEGSLGFNIGGQFACQGGRTWGCVHHLLVRYKKQGHSVTVLVAQDN